MKVLDMVGLRPLLAMLPPLIAFILQRVFWPTIRPYVWFLFFLAVFVSSWIGGLVPGLLSTFISVALAAWFFIPPQFTFADKAPLAPTPITLFCIMGCLLDRMYGRLRNANRLSEEIDVTKLIAQETRRCG